MACIGMAFIAMAYIAMAYIAMAYIAMAYIAMDLRSYGIYGNSLCCYGLFISVYAHKSVPMPIRMSIHTSTHMGVHGHQRFSSEREIGRIANGMYVAITI